MSDRSVPAPSLDREAQKIVNAVLSQPQNKRIKTLKDGLKNLPPETRDAVETLVLLALESAGPSQSKIWSEANGLIRTGLAFVGAILGYYLGGQITVEGKVLGLTLKAGGCAAMFVFIFLLYPPPIMKWPFGKSRSKKS